MTLTFKAYYLWVIKGGGVKLGSYRFTLKEAIDKVKWIEGGEVLVVRAPDSTDERNAVTAIAGAQVGWEKYGSVVNYILLGRMPKWDSCVWYIKGIYATKKGADVDKEPADRLIPIRHTSYKRDARFQMPSKPPTDIWI